MDQLELVARLAVAAAAGAVVGFEREARNHVAGMRTHSLVSLGAALFTVAGAYGFTDVHHGPNVDPARVAAQVASGIGFIGAGAIIRRGTSVRGVTTAATLWLAAAIGLAAGAGLYVVVLAGTAVVLAVLVALGWAGRSLDRLARRGTLEVTYERGHGTLGPLLRTLEDRRSRVRSLVVDDDGDGLPGLRHVTIDLVVQGDVTDVIADLRARDEVRDERWRGDREAA